MPFALLSLLLPALALAKYECADTCRKLPVRLAELRCLADCERRSPENELLTCREFTPCLITCEEKIPSESELTQAIKDAKTACNGVCFTKYFKVDCKDARPRPPGSDGGGAGGRQAGAQGGGPAFALPSESGLAVGAKAAAAGSAGAGIASAPAVRSEGVEAAIRNAEEATAKTLAAAAAARPAVPSGIAAELSDQGKKAEADAKARPEQEHLWQNLQGGLKPQSFEEKGVMDSALAEVVKASIGEADELTLFQRVTRAYRGTAQWSRGR